MVRASEDWINEQLRSGKQENEIIVLLVQKGWTEEDARKALANARKPSTLQRLTKVQRSLLFVALLSLGAFLLDMDGLIFSQGSASRTVEYIIPAAAIMCAILFLGWALHSISIRHAHPKLHWIFFLYLSGLLVAGYMAWGVMFVMPIIEGIPIVFTTFALIILCGVLFGLFVVLLEYHYNQFRQAYDHVPARAVGRLAVSGAIVAAICIALLLPATFWGERWLVDYANEQHDAFFARMDQEMEQAKMQNRLEQIPNPILRARFIDDLRRYEESKEQHIPYPNVEQFLTDALVRENCDAVAGDLDAAIIAGMDARLLEHYAQFAQQERSRGAPDVAAYRQALAPKPSAYQEQYQMTQHRMTNDLIECAATKSSQGQDWYRGFPAEPDLSNPAQRELVEFVLWREAQKT